LSQKSNFINILPSEHNYVISKSIKNASTHSTILIKSKNNNYLNMNITKKNNLLITKS